MLGACVVGASGAGGRGALGALCLALQRRACQLPHSSCRRVLWRPSRGPAAASCRQLVRGDPAGIVVKRVAEPCQRAGTGQLEPRSGARTKVVQGRAGHRPARAARQTISPWATEAEAGEEARCVGMVSGFGPAPVPPRPA